MSSIFISYSSKDSAAGSRLRDVLEARGYVAVFRDKDEEHGIPAGTKWFGELFASLERADVIIFLASAASLASPWCHTELAVGAAGGKHMVQISLHKEPIHPLLADRQALPPNPDLAELVDSLVGALSLVGFAPGGAFTWDTDRSPFPGLSRLDEAHAAVLFGRDAEVGTCIQRLNGPRPLPLLVSGPSGSGKSSLIRAGVLPRLRRQHGTRVLPVVEPGNSPLQRVALAFAANGQGEDASALIADPNGFAFAVDRLVASGVGRVVLFLDQAEDLTARVGPAQVADLVARLQKVDPDRLAVIAAVRSASLEAWLQDPNLAWFGQADPVWVRPLDRSALRDVIVGPAHVAGIRFEPETLVERIVDDTAQGNALPLLAALLQELTEGHSRLAPAVITETRYREVGPVARVIERRAQAASDDIRARRQVAESLVIDAYLRLVEIDDEGRVTAAELPVHELAPDVRTIFDDLEVHRLVTRDQRIVAGTTTGVPGTPQNGARAVEVIAAVHEAIFRAWPAVAAAIKARRTDLEIRTWLRRDARTWVESGGGQAALTGGRLGLAREWAERNPVDVTPDMQSYLGAAISQVRRRRLLTVAVPVLAIATLLVGGLALQAVSEAQRAEVARAEADALRIAGDARGAFASRPDLGLLLAMDAAARSDELQLAAMPLVALTQGPGPRRFEDVGQRLQAAALDGSGARAVLRATDGFLLWDVDAARSVGTIAGSGDVLAISADGATVAVGQPDGVTIHAWGSTEARASCPSPGGTITGITLSDSGDEVVLVSDDARDPSRSRVDVLRTSDCGHLSTLSQVRGRVGAVAIDVPGDRIAIASDEAGPGLWQPSTGLPFRELGPPGEEPELVRALAFGTDDRLAAAAGGGELLVWDLGDLEAGPQRFRVHGTDQVVTVAFAIDDDSLLTGAASGEMRRVRPTAEPPVGPPLQALPALDYEGRSVGPLDIAVDGSRAVSVDPSGRVVVWDLDGHPPLGPELAVGPLYDRLAAMPDGSVVAADRQGIYVLGGSDGRLISQAPLAGVTAIGTGSAGWAVGTDSGEVLVPSGVGPDMRLVAAISGQSVVGLTPLPDGGWAAATTKGRGGSVTVARGTGERHDLAMATTPTTIASDGTWLFVGDMAGVVHVLAVADLARPERLVPAHAFDIGSMALSADGSTLATGSDDRSIALWNVAPDGGLSERARLRGHEERVRSITFSPDGAWLASADEEPAVRLWNLNEERPVGDSIEPASVRPVVAFLPGADRQLLVAANRLDRWDMRSEEWPRIACGIIGSRRLAEAERERYLGGEQPVATCP